MFRPCAFRPQQKKRTIHVLRNRTILKTHDSFLPRIDAVRDGFWYHARDGVVRRKDKKPRGSTLASRVELSEFLASVERRAFKQAVFAVRDQEHALDIVQDSMLKIAEKYGAKPAAEWPMLFQRILQNTIRDFYRRQKVRSLWTTLFSSLSTNREDEDFDPLETLEEE